MSDPTFWILARASGVTAYVLLTCAVLAGLAVKSRPFGRAVRAASATDTHNFLSLLALAAVGVHGLTLALDSTVKIGPAALLVPGAASYRPLWTGIGVVAAELAVLIVLSFRVRRMIGAKAWRRLHWLTYGVFAAATAHAIGAGTDIGRRWASGLYVGAVGAVAAATAWRALTRTSHSTTKGGTDVQDRDRPVRM